MNAVSWDRASRNQPAILLKGVSRTFHGHLGIGRTDAVTDLSLEVGAGEIFGLLGPNGAGKTTTLTLILGLLRPTRGEVRLMGRAPADPAARARVGFLPENPYFYDYLTAAEFLNFYGRLRGLPAGDRRGRVKATLARVGLAGKEGVPLRKFSKGMIQRIGLAQAIEHDPDLVVLDEPMSGLDPVGRHEVRDLILSLKGEGKTVFFSSHILQDAEMICDRVVILVDGRLRYEGRLDEVLSRRVKWFEAAVTGPLPGDVPGKLLSASGGETLLRVEDVETLEALLAAVRRSGGTVTAVWPRRDTLEDLFLREVRRQGNGGARP